MLGLFTWLALLEILGLVFLPLTNQLFPFFIDRGAAFSKMLGLLLFGWLAWWFAWLGVAPFTARSMRTLMTAFLVVIAVRSFKNRSLWKRLLSRNFFISSLVFWLAALVFAWVVSGRAAIYDTEKLSDFHFLRACMDSATIPPADLWFGGAPINYYYFGYTIFAALGLLGGFDAPVVYNFAVLTIAALTAAGLFSLGWSLGGKKRYGAVAVVFALVLGNPHGLYDLYLYLSGNNDGYYSFWEASRAVSQTITEFPFFSMYLGDLHPHYIILPWLVMAVAIAWALLRAPQESEKNNLVALSAVAALLLGMTYATNTWNYPVVGLLFSSAYLLRFSDKKFFMSGLQAAGISVAIAVGGAICFLPFHKHYQSVGGAPLRWLPRHVMTPIHEFIAAWGHLWLPILFASSCLLLAHCRDVRKRLWWIIVGLAAAAMVYKPALPFVLMVLGTTASGAYLYLLWRQRQVGDDRRLMATLLLFFAFAIGLFMEVAFFDDLYDNSNFIRGNTVFKFSFLYFVLLPPLLVFLSTTLSGRGRRVYLGLLGLLVMVGAVYPIFVMRENIIYNERSGIARTLDGAAFMKKDAAAEYRLSEWLRGNLLGSDAVILERIEESHKWGGRLAAFSGVNSVLNWVVSEGIWRGNAIEIKHMQQQLNFIYNGGDDLAALQAIERYKISHVVVAPYELRQYSHPMPLDRKFPVVYDQDGIKVYETRSVRRAPHPSYK